MNSEIITGDCREEVAKMPEQHFQCCVTSPPYFGLRDYGHDGQIGIEPTPDDFVAAMLAVFGGKDNPVGVWRVLRDDGVLWLNLGDSYARNPKKGGSGTPNGRNNRGEVYPNKGKQEVTGPVVPNGAVCDRATVKVSPKEKDLLGIPWRVAFALQAAGWYLRDAVIWHKPAPMPGSQRDRCTPSYEFIFMLTKKPKYYFDMEAAKEPAVCSRMRGPAEHGSDDTNGNGGLSRRSPQTTRTPRNVWKMAHEGFKGSHFATYPLALPTKCITGSASEKGCCSGCGAPMVREVNRTSMVIDRSERTHSMGRTRTSGTMVEPPTTTTTGWSPSCKCDQSLVPCRILDPFNGAGTTGVAANILGHDYIGIEINPEYAEMSRKYVPERIAKEQAT